MQPGNEAFRQPGRGARKHGRGTGADSVVHSSVSAIPGGQYVREVDVGQIVGNTALKFGGEETSRIRIFTDEAGNLITVYPIPAPY